MVRRGRGADEFERRLKELDRAVGRGPLVGKVVFDQRYAQNQHESLHFKHPHGGEAKFLERPLLEGAEDFMRHLASRAITQDGSELKEGMGDVVEDLARQSAKRSPRWFGDLPNSAHPTVEDDGRVIYDRAPAARRLTDEEIRLKNRWRVHPSKRGRRRLR